MALAEKLRLESLSMGLCCCMSDESAFALASTHSSCLARLDVWGCDKITNRGVEALTVCSRLQRLSLAGTFDRFTQR